MLRNGLGVLAVIALAVAANGCKTSGSANSENSGVPPLLSAEAAGISETIISAGRTLYIRKCASCHRFYHPADYPASEWQSWMSKMSRKSRLNRNEEEVLSTYLNGFRQPSTH